MLVTCLGFLIHKKALCQRGSRCSVVGHSADGDTFSSLWFCFFTSSYLVASAEEVLFSPVTFCWFVSRIT